jgi:predicted secreted protein
MPQRSRRVAVVSHCHLNVNTKVHGLADYEGVRTEVIHPLVQSGTGIVQLPCPEATYLGMHRWAMTCEQYDTPSYRRHCQRILEPVVDTLAALSGDGCEIEAVIGVDGSPSCGVARTCVGYRGGKIGALSEPGGAQAAVDAGAPGIFMEVFRSLLIAAGLDVAFRGVEEGAGSA